MLKMIRTTGNYWFWHFSGVRDVGLESATRSKLDAFAAVDKILAAFQ